MTLNRQTGFELQTLPESPMQGSGWQVLPLVLRTQRQSLPMQLASVANEQPRTSQCAASDAFHWHWLSLVHALSDVYTQTADVQLPFTKMQFGSVEQPSIVGPAYLNEQSKTHTPLWSHVQKSDCAAQSDDDRKVPQAVWHLSLTYEQMGEASQAAPSIIRSHWRKHVLLLLSHVQLAVAVHASCSGVLAQGAMQ